MATTLGSGTVVSSTDRSVTVGDFTVSGDLSVTGSFATGRTATYVIAASDSPAHVKLQADYTMPSATADVGVIIEAAKTAGYRSIHFSQGNFAASTYWNLNATMLDIGGEGESTIVTVSDSADIGSLVYATANNFRIHDLVLDGNGSNQSTCTALIRLKANGNRVERVKIQNTYGTTPSIMYDTGGYDWITDCRFVDAGSLTSSTGGAPVVTEVHVSGCSFVNPVVGDTNSVIGGSVTGYFIKENRCENLANANGVFIDPAASVGCVVEGNIDQTNAGGSFYANGAAGLIIIGNEFEEELRVDSSTNVTLLGNHYDLLTLIDVTTTERSGTWTVANGQTSVVVTHGLSFTPVAGDIAIGFSSLGNSASCYIDTYTATQFTVHVNADPGAATATGWWKASR